jgi:hypothetical protein
MSDNHLPNGGASFNAWPPPGNCHAGMPPFPK